MSATDLPERFNAAAFFVDRHVTEGRGARPAFRHSGRSISYAELSRDVNRLAGVLLGLGVEMENRVLLALHDSPTFVAAFWGAAKIGAIAVPVSPAMTTEEYAFLLQDSRAKVAIVDVDVAARLIAVQRHCPSLRSIVVAGRAMPGALGLDDLLGESPASVEPAPTVRDDMMYWGYTSGSTGQPKAAVHSHAEFVAAADLVGVGVFGLSGDDVTFSASKMYFAFGLGNSLYFPLRVGGSSVLVSERIDPERAFAVIAAERPSVFFTVPTLYARMLAVEDAARRYDLSSLRLCVSSGEALPPAIFDGWHKHFGRELVDVVGATEALHDFIANTPGAARRGSSGRVIAGFAARLVDDRGDAVPTGTVGHLLINGPTTSRYYWNRSERTRATMLGEWLRTGDMFSQDADGYFYFAGRSDDMLKVAGLWVSPAEIEAQILEHPAILEAGVVGCLGADGLTRPHAFVVLKAESVPSPALEAELLSFLRRRLPAHKTPAAIAVVADLPKTSTGKIQRFRLRETAGAEASPRPLR